jgi:hypothetical protein
MIHIVKINDESTTGKRLISNLRKHPKDVQFEDQIQNSKVREGYYTLEEFRKIAIEKGQQFCDKHGII